MGQRLKLQGVPETMLWPLWHRAHEAMRPDRLIDDPLCIQVMKSIDYDFRRHFGPPRAPHAIRARVSDDLIRDYIKQASNPVVVALGEGLETQFWRIGSDDVEWFSVDVAEAVAVRRQCLPSSDQIQMVEASVLDLSWMDKIPAHTAPFISAAGLLMYFKVEDVRSLLCAIAQRFAGAHVFFDTIPQAFSKKTLKGFKVTPHYTAPPMPWGVNWQDLPEFVEAIEGLNVVQIQTYAEPFPKRMPIANLLSNIPALKTALAPCLVHLRTASAPG